MPPPTTPAPAPAPALPVELLEEIFLRLPPDEPAGLVRASLASKFWLGLLTGARFRGLYREFHGSPPMLGFLYNRPLEYAPGEEEGNAPHFVATTKFGARIPEGDTNWEDYNVLDCRHGRVLLFNPYMSPARLVVWDPMTGCRKEGGAPEELFSSISAAVLCDVSGCDNQACDEDSFQVVFVGLDKLAGGYVAYESLSSSETEEIEWTEPSRCFDHLLDNGDVKPSPPVLVDDALHFMLVYDDDRAGILKYDLVSTCLSLIDAPLEETDNACDVILVAMEDGSLGFAHVDGLTFNLWSWQMGSDGVEAWTGCIVINLKELLPIQNPEERLRLIGSVEGCDVVFVTTDLGIYEINLKSQQQKKIWKREKYRALFPYMSFYNLHGTEVVYKNNLETAECKIGRSYGVRRGKLVPGRLRSYYWSRRYSQRQPRAPKGSRGEPHGKQPGTAR